MSIEINVSDSIVEVTPSSNQIDINVTDSPIEVNVTDQIVEVTSSTGLIQFDPTYLITNVRNRTGALIPKFKVVYINGATGNKPTIALASNTNEQGSSKTYGVTRDDIANNGTGYVVTVGELQGINTSAFNEGDALWLGANGGVVTAPPISPLHLVFIGFVVRSHPTLGVIDVRIQNGYELGELHDVLISNPTNGQVLKYNSTTGLWVNSTDQAGTGTVTSVNASGGTGISVSGVPITTSGTITITNTAPDQIVSLSGAGTTSISGTYPSFTITSNDQYTGTVTSVSASGGTGISVSGSPITSSGTLTITNTAPDQIVSLTGTGTTSITGTYPSFTINSADQFTGTVTSVGLTSATSGLTITNTPITTSGNINLEIATASGSQNGLLSSTDWTTFNNKQNALTNPVTGTGTTNYVPKFTGASTIGDSIIFDNGSGVGIGTTSLTGYSLRVSKNITGGILSIGIQSDGQTQSDVTSTVGYFRTVSSTEDATFTLNALVHYSANQGTFGASSTITNQYGFFAGNTLTGATNNFGFRGQIASGTGRWNLYMDGTANNYLAGSLGIGTTSLTGYELRVSADITGSVNSHGVSVDGSIQSDVTGQARLFYTNATTQATTFTLGTIFHFLAAQGTFGAGSTVSNQHGFRVGATLIGATNNYGFSSDLAVSGTSRWSLFLGTAPNQLQGNTIIGINQGAIGYQSLAVQKAITGNTIAWGVANVGQVQSGVTSRAEYYGTTASTQAATFTLSNLFHYRADQGTFGAGSTVTTQTGFVVTANLIGAGTNYGFRGLIPSGSNRWNLFMDGTAINHINGRLLLGTTTDNTVDQLQVSGSSKFSSSVTSTQFRLSALNTAPASATATGTLGEIRIDANFIYICTATNTWKRAAIATW